MVVKIRLARFGRRNSPFYNIVISHARYVALVHPLSCHVFLCFSQSHRTAKQKSMCSLTDYRPLSSCYRTARNSKPLEVIGTYDPIPKPDPYASDGKLHKDIKLDTARARYWVGVGAQPTDTAWRLLSMAGIVPKKNFGPKRDAESLTVDVENVKIR
jgi:small subunit ribosomal protein S16